MLFCSLSMVYAAVLVYELPFKLRSRLVSNKILHLVQYN